MDVCLQLYHLLFLLTLITVFVSNGGTCCNTLPVTSQYTTVSSKFADFVTLFV